MYDNLSLDIDHFCTVCDCPIYTENEIIRSECNQCYANETEQVEKQEEEEGIK